MGFALQEMPPRLFSQPDRNVTEGADDADLKRNQLCST